MLFNNKKVLNNKLDIITIKDLNVYAFHGVSPEENKLGQTFFITAQLFTDTHKAGITDSLKETINYADVCHFINDYTKNHIVKLIEAAAEQLAEQILLHFPQIVKITLTIKKPGAPIGLPLKYTSVTISRTWHESFIAFGSNMGNREKYINDAIESLKTIPKIRIAAISDFYASTPYGTVKQADFINGVIKIYTLLTPHELLDNIHRIEQTAGRERTIHWGPRTLDLDILFYDDEIIADNALIVPHSDMTNRDFVMAPLNQIAPYKIHPLLKKSVQELYNSIPSDQIHIIKRGNI